MHALDATALFGSTGPIPHPEFRTTLAGFTVNSFDQTAQLAVREAAADLFDVSVHQVTISDIQIGDEHYEDRRLGPQAEQAEQAEQVEQVATSSITCTIEVVAIPANDAVVYNHPLLTDTDGVVALFKKETEKPKFQGESPSHSLGSPLRRCVCWVGSSIVYSAAVCWEG